MQIDWLTAAAQAVNFLILLFLLKRFLYQPILRTMRAREEAIVRQVEEAERTRGEAARELEAHARMRRDLEESQAALFAEARAEAASRKREMEAEARRDVAGLRRRWLEAAEQEKPAFLAERRQRTGREVCGVARRVLEDLADEDLERRIVESFLDRLARLEEPWPPAGASGEEPEEVTVRTAGELSAPLAERVREALVRRAGRPVALRFAVDPEVICGIEARSRGHKLAWSVRDALEGLEERLFEAAPPAPAEPEPLLAEARPGSVR